MRRTFIYLLVLLLPLSVWGQTTVKLKRTGRFKQELIDGQPIQKLIDSVWLVQGNTNIFCDSAYLSREKNSMRAFGHVRIIDIVDPIDVSSDYLEYNGNQRIARLRDNVIMKDDSTTLYTNYLDYDRDTKTGFYYNGGKLIDDTNELTSKTGYYNSVSKKSEFYDSVRMWNDEFYLETDTLFYNTHSSQSKTLGPTLGITNDKDTLESANGLIYNRQTRYAEIYNGRVFNEEYDIKADTLITNDSLQLYDAYRNVVMTSKQDSMTIFGNRAQYNKANKTALAYENAYLRKLMEGDSLFIKADTLFSDQNDPENKFLTAYHGVQMFKSNMQGIADSITYNFSDSTIYMYQDPVIWSNDSQISADSIDIEIVNNKVHKMNLAVKSFVIAQDSAKNFNQVSGKTMEVYFKEGYVHKTDVNGNGESIYFVVEKTGAVSMNRLKCSDMALYFDSNSVTEIRTYIEIDGNIIPDFEIEPRERRLRGFNWRFREKPKLRDIALHLRYDR